MVFVGGADGGAFVIIDDLPDDAGLNMSLKGSDFISSFFTLTGAVD